MTRSTADAPTKPRRERRSTLFGLGRDLLLPPNLKRVPKPIAEANKAAHEAYEQWEAAKAKAHELAAQAKAAPRFDEHAAEAAIAAGEEPPSATAGHKRAKAEEARQVATAAENVAKSRVRALYDAVEDHFDEYLEPRREFAEQAVEPLRKSVSEFLDRLVTFRVENALYQLARRFENNPRSSALGGHSGRDPAVAIQRSYERALEQRRQTLYAHTDVPNKLPDLLAAITLLIEAEIEGKEPR